MGTLRRMITTAALLLLLCVLFMAAAPAIAERLLYYPSTADPGSPPPAGDVSGVNLRLIAEDGVRVDGWWYEIPGAPAVLLLHGNAGHLGQRGFIARELVARGWSVLLAGYRGYGTSEGTPSEAGLLRDGRVAYRFLVEHAGSPERVALFGRSLGAAVAAQLAAEAEPGALILDSAFTSLEEIAGAVYPFVPRILLRRLRGRYDSRAALGRVRAPLLVIHAGEDRLVPEWMGRELYERSEGPKHWFPVEGAGHNDLIDRAGARYFREIDAFLRAHLSPP